MKHSITKYLSDILLSIDFIKQYIKDVKDFTEYEASDLLKDAVGRRLAIIGEALFQANKHNAALPISYKGQDHRS